MTTRKQDKRIAIGIAIVLLFVALSPGASIILARVIIGVVIAVLLAFAFNGLD